MVDPIDHYQNHIGSWDFRLPDLDGLIEHRSTHHVEPNVDEDDYVEVLQVEETLVEESAQEKQPLVFNFGYHYERKLWVLVGNPHKVSLALCAHDAERKLNTVVCNLKLRYDFVFPQLQNLEISFLNHLRKAESL